MKRITILLLIAIAILVTSCHPEPTYGGNLIEIRNYTNGNASMSLRRASDPPSGEFMPLPNGEIFVEVFPDQKTSYVLVFRVMDGDAVIDMVNVDIDMIESYYYEAHFFYSTEHGIECVSRYK